MKSGYLENILLRRQYLGYQIIYIDKVNRSSREVSICIANVCIEDSFNVSSGLCGYAVSTMSEVRKVEGRL